MNKLLLSLLFVCACSAKPSHIRVTKSALNCDALFMATPQDQAPVVVTAISSFLHKYPLDWTLAKELETTYGEDLVICTVQLFDDVLSTKAASELSDAGKAAKQVSREYLKEKLGHE